MELNQIYNEDCLGVNGICAIPDKSIDMILCDLPYGASGCRWDSILPFNDIWSQYNRVIKDDGAIALFAGQPFSSFLLCSNPEMFRYRWVWDKIQGGNFQLAKLQPMNTVEDILIFSKAKTANGAKLNMRYYPIKTQRDKPTRSGGNPSTTDLLHNNNMVALKNVYTDKYPTSILRFAKPSNSERIHPTQKPVDLCEYLINTYTVENDTVLDNCMGSGTTAIACININRNFIGFEKDTDIYDKCINRICDRYVGLSKE